MYRQFFGLRDRPFDLTANPRFLFLSSGHLEALSLLLYGLTGEKGITLLVGEAGTGKTTLLRAALSRQDPSVMQVLHLTDSTLTRWSSTSSSRTALACVRTRPDRRRRFYGSSSSHWPSDERPDSSPR